MRLLEDLQYTEASLIIYVDQSEYRNRVPLREKRDALITIAGYSRGRLTSFDGQVIPFYWFMYVRLF